MKEHLCNTAFFITDIFAYKINEQIKCYDFIRPFWITDDLLLAF